MARKPKEYPKRPPFKAGDMLRTAFRPHREDIHRPVECKAIREGPSVSGWLVLVATTIGDKEYCASHFSLDSQR